MLHRLFARSSPLRERGGCAKAEPSEDETAPVELVIRLGTDLREGLAVPVALEAEWSAERVWPYPDELPDDPVIFALQEVFAATDEDRDAALDALDLATPHICQQDARLRGSSAAAGRIRGKVTAKSPLLATCNPRRLAALQ